MNFQRAPEGMSHDSYIWDLGEGQTRQRPGALAGRDPDRRRPLTAPLSGVQAQPRSQTREQETRFISRSVIRAFKTRPHKVPIVGPRREGQIESQEEGPGEGPRQWGGRGVGGAPLCPALRVLVPNAQPAGAACPPGSTPRAELAGGRPALRPPRCRHCENRRGPWLVGRCRARTGARYPLEQRSVPRGGPHSPQNTDQETAEARGAWASVKIVG